MTLLPYPPHHCKALNSLICADVPLRNYSLTHSRSISNFPSSLAAVVAGHNLFLRPLSPAGNSGPAVNDKPPVDGVVTISTGRDDGPSIGDGLGTGDGPGTDNEPATGYRSATDDKPATDDEWLTASLDDAEAAGASEK